MRKERNIRKQKDVRREILRIFVTAACIGAFNGALHTSLAIADTDIGFTDANNVTVHVNTDDATAGAFVVYNGTDTNLPTALLGGLASSTITAYTNGSAGPGAAVVGGQLVVNTTGVDISAGTLTVGGSTVATETYVTSAVSSEATARSTADGVLQTDINTRVVTDSSASLHGLNNNGFGITNAGNVSGVNTLTSTTISNSGDLTVSGTSTLNGATNVNNNLTVNSGAGSAELAVATNSVAVLGTTNINTTGAAATNIGNYGNSIDMKASNVYIYTGGGANSIYMDGANVDLMSGANSVGLRADTGTTVTGAATINGTTNINTSVNNVTNINTGTSNAAVTVGNTNNTVSILGGTNTIGNAGSSANTVTGTTNTITATAANTITGGTGNTISATTGNNTISAVAGNNTLSANATTGVNNIEAKSNNIGVATAASINTIGNINAATTVSSYGGAGYSTLNNAASTMGTGTGGMVQTTATTATIRASNSGTLATNGINGTMVVGAGGGYMAYNSTQNSGVGTTVGGVVDNKSYTNKVNGNLFVDGNVYINGTLDYVSSNSANTTVVGLGSGTSILTDPTHSTSAGTAIVLKGSAGAQTVVDANGKLTNVNGVATESTAALTLTNGIGNVHGLVVTETKAVLSGGTHSSSLTMDDNGATFSDVNTGRPVQVHGVNDGTADFDAVNVRQMAAGVAMAAGLAALPQVEPGKTFALTAGSGVYMSRVSLAMGVSGRFMKDFVVKGGVAFVPANTKAHATGNIGIAYSF